jgi:serine/threonine kinase 32
VPKDYFPEYGPRKEPGRSSSRTRSTSRGATARSNQNRNSPPKGTKPWVVEENLQGRADAEALRVAAGDDKRPSGMLAFLSRKKGRDRSPKAKERGVLGKEGARVVVQP